jgi:inorganic pyrophosphatase
VIIEIPMNADPIKYEVDKETGAMFVDRFMSTGDALPVQLRLHPADAVGRRRSGRRPRHHAVSADGERRRHLPADRHAQDGGRGGGDAKLLAVPIDKILGIYSHWQKPADMNELRLRQIQHFFEHYKDLEPGKWVKVSGWEGPTRRAPRSATASRRTPRARPTGRRSARGSVAPASSLNGRRSFSSSR